MTWNLSSRKSPSIKVQQGDVKASDDPTVVFSALVGSCIATCLYDPVARVGGMNHFLLAECPNENVDSMLLGINQMELLVNQILKLGGRKKNLKAKLFGGNSMGIGYGNLGQKNADLAVSFLTDENIPIISASIAGNSAQRVELHPTTGRVRARNIVDKVSVVVPEPVKVPVSVDNQGDVDFF